MHGDLWHDFNLAWWRRMLERAGLDEGPRRPPEPPAPDAKGG